MTDLIRVRSTNQKTKVKEATVAKCVQLEDTHTVMRLMSHTLAFGSLAFLGKSFCLTESRKLLLPLSLPSLQQFWATFASASFALAERLGRADGNGRVVCVDRKGTAVASHCIIVQSGTQSSCTVIRRGYTLVHP